MEMRISISGTATLAVLLMLAMVSPAFGDVQTTEQDDKTESTESAVSEVPNDLLHILNPGEREYLSPNLIGVQNIAMTFLPLTMNFVNIIDAFREVVNGVRYEILINAIDMRANDTEIVCRQVVLEKPWLLTEWGDKVRELLHSNCTDDADDKQHATFSNSKYENNMVFNGGTRNELTPDEMIKLASQIVPTEQTTAPSTTTTAKVIISKPESIPDATTASPIVTSDEENSAEPKELREEEKKWLDDIFSVAALNFEKSLQEQGKKPVDDDADDESDNTQQQQFEEVYEMELQQQPLPEQFEHINQRSKRADEPIVGGSSQLEKSEAKLRLQKTLDKIATGDTPSFKIAKIHSATTQVVSGSLTKIDADLIDNNEKKIRCNIEIWSQAWLPNGNEVTIECPGKETVKTRHSRSVEYAEKKTHKKRAHHGYEKTEHLFNKFQIKYNKRYHTTAERQMRLRIFRQNIKTIEELNRNEMGSAKYGITEFADLTTTEYKQRTGLVQRPADQPSKNALAEIPDIVLPKEFDWREKGVVSKVKNQGSCGSCWAFSVTGNIEGLHAIKTGKLEEYSEQELLDCDTIDSACNGGLPDNAYEAIKEIGGLELESEYPYEARKERCEFKKALVHVKVKNGVDLPKNETAMAQWLVENGPISIGINANAMQFYRGGVSHPLRPLCSPKNLDHGVLIVGYGVSEYPMFKKILPYWIIKNSWGSGWGEQGYYRVYRGDNTCGVSEMPTSAVLA